MSQDPTLYVIFHGSFAFFQTDQNITVLIPDLGTAHSYRAGGWLVETPIEKGSQHVLTNVTGGTDGLKNFLISGAKPPTASNNLFATLVFPRPKRFHALFQVVVPLRGIPLVSTDVIIPYIHVFEYTYATGPLLGTQWAPSSAELASWPQPLTLHIVSEEESRQSEEHPVDAFGITCSLLGMKLDFRVDEIHIKLASIQDPVPPGMEERCFEFAPLYIRRDNLLKIAQGKEETGQLIDPWSNLLCGPDNIKELAGEWFAIGLGPLGNESCLSLSADGSS
jgi:hypothetical protein